VTGSGAEGGGPATAAPPPELLDALDAAAEAVAELERRGYRVRFRLEVGAEPTIELVDREGRVTRELTAGTLAALLARAD
jgi:hypothetical protein